jgi:UDP-N-acetylmuramate dehydrogenase
MTLLKSDILLKSHSSFKIGGSAKFYAEPKSFQELQSILQETERLRLRPFVFGFGSNLLFPDDTAPDQCFVSLKYLTDIDYLDDTLHLSAGVPLTFLAIIGHKFGQDFDFTYLLPGSVAAGVYINARYMEREIGQIVKTVQYLDLDDTMKGVQQIEQSQCLFGYKKSIFQQQNWLITGVDIGFPDVTSGQLAEMCEVMEQISSKLSIISDIYMYGQYFTDLIRKEGAISDSLLVIEEHRNRYKHFAYPSAGSVFKNDRRLGKPIGLIIDELGLKGKSEGDAVISPDHGNIIFNRGSARASDVLKLIDTMSKEIFGIYGIRPETEITIIE